MESYTMLSRFLKSRREKKNDKTSRGGKKKDKLYGAGKDDKSDTEDKDEFQKSDIPTNEIDEEGYTLRPLTTCENDKSSFYSSSDSDEERDTKLRVEIKPLRNGTVPLSASVDELRSTVENMTLSPIGTAGRKVFEGDIQMKRSQSVSQQIGNSSPLLRYSYSPLSPPIPPPNPRSSPKVLTNNTSSISRYSELGDIFSEIGEIQPTTFPQIQSQRNTPTPTNGLIAIPRPPLRLRPETVLSSTLSPPSPAVSTMEREVNAKSFGDHSNFRGPSPLTTDVTDSIPLAVAFHEIVHASFKGNDENQCQVKMAGDIMVSFPLGIIQVFAKNPKPAQLRFQVISNLELDNLVPNDELISVQKEGNDLTFDFDMNALILLMKKYAEENSGSSYFNVDVLKYNIKPKPGVSSCPLHLVAFWKFDKLHTDLRIDYKYNSSALATSHPEVHNTKLNKCKEESLLDVCIAAPIDGGVTTMQSKPTGQWFGKTNRACWKVPNLSISSENLGVGSLRARFDVTNGPSTQSSIAAQFSCDNSTLSGSEFKLLDSGYRVSLIKKRFISGKYTCETSSSTKTEVLTQKCLQQVLDESDPLLEPASSSQPVPIKNISSIEDSITLPITSSPTIIPISEMLEMLDVNIIRNHAMDSKGPSPLTLGMTDTIPLAVAFHEIVHACFKGYDESHCEVSITGDMMVSFPAGIIQVSANNPIPAQLKFRVTSYLEFDNLVPNDELLSVQKEGNDLTFDFDMSSLIRLMKKYAEENSGFSYFNVDILKYHIIPKPGVGSCPLHLVAFWKFEKLHTDLRIDYKYNSSALATSHSEVQNKKLNKSKLEPLIDVCIAAPVDGGVTTMQSKPTGQWFGKTNRACWKIPSLSTSENLGVGSLRARFEITNGPSSQSSIAAKFSCENSTLSGSEFKLLGTGYRVSLIKKRFISGKYTCETQPNILKSLVLPENGQDCHNMKEEC